MYWNIDFKLDFIFDIDYQERFDEACFNMKINIYHLLIKKWIFAINFTVHPLIFSLFPQVASEYHTIIKWIICLISSKKQWSQTEWFSFVNYLNHLRKNVVVEFWINELTNKLLKIDLWCKLYWNKSIPISINSYIIYPFYQQFKLIRKWIQHNTYFTFDTMTDLITEIDKPLNKYFKIW